MTQTELEFMLPDPPEHDINLLNCEDVPEPMRPQLGGSLYNLGENLLKGDITICVLCDQHFECSELEPAKENLPRVLYCGDCICEHCISKLITKASISDPKIGNVAACTITCPICCMRHIFKLTKTGYLICNDKYIKMQDDQGPVNYFPVSRHHAAGVNKDSKLLLMDGSVTVPTSLVVRSLPINIEIVNLIKDFDYDEDEKLLA